RLFLDVPSILLLIMKITIHLYYRGVQQRFFLKKESLHFVTCQKNTAHFIQNHQSRGGGAQSAY
ncbi:MAG: hypothetical protein IIV23_01125, partial [Ruminococcus sp.]|nr:hypothetical protein [Ruminococcus sp.]